MKAYCRTTLILVFFMCIVLVIYLLSLLLWIWILGVLFAQHAVLEFMMVCVGANTIIMEIIHKEKLNNTFEYYWCKERNTQHYLNWGVVLTFFKEIQVLGWLNLVTGADLLWLVSPRIQQPNKCRMARTTSAQSIQAQSSTRKNTLPCHFWYLHSSPPPCARI